MPRWENFWVIIPYFYIEMMGHPRRNLFFLKKIIWNISPLIWSHYEWILIWWEQKVHLTISFWEKCRGPWCCNDFFFLKKKTEMITNVEQRGEISQFFNYRLKRGIKMLHHRHHFSHPQHSWTNVTLFRRSTDKNPIPIKFGFREFCKNVAMN